MMGCLQNHSQGQDSHSPAGSYRQHEQTRTGFDMFTHVWAADKNRGLLADGDSICGCRCLMSKADRCESQCGNKI